MAGSKTICLDFDGVIHKYSKGYDDGAIYDTPKKKAIESIIRLMDYGFKVVISTVRPNMDEIPNWLKKNNLPEEYIDRIKITNKKPVAIAYIDDRGIRFEDNWDSILNYFI